MIRGWLECFLVLGPGQPAGSLEGSCQDSGFSSLHSAAGQQGSGAGVLGSFGTWTSYASGPQGGAIVGRCCRYLGSDLCGPFTSLPGTRVSWRWQTSFTEEADHAHSTEPSQAGSQAGTWAAGETLVPPNPSHQVGHTHVPILFLAGVSGASAQHLGEQALPDCGAKYPALPARSDREKRGWGGCVEPEDKSSLC